MFETLSAHIEARRRAGDFPDAVCAVFSAEELLYSAAFGGAGPDTWFDLASLTKLFTSTLLLDQVRAGRLGLEDSAADLLGPETLPPALARTLSGVTLERLLTHTSGLMPWYPFYTREEPFYTVLDGLVAQNGLLRGMYYSDLNFMLAGRIAERAAGCPLPEALRRAGLSDGTAGPVFLPRGCAPAEKLRAAGLLAVSSYGNGVEETMCARRGLAFSGWRGRTRPVLGEANDGNCWYAFGGVSGHAGLFAPVGALVRLGQFYLKAGGIFARAMADAGAGRGLGFELGEKYPRGCGHTGFTGTSLWISPEMGVGAAILTNRLAFPGQDTPPDLTDFRREAHECVLRELGRL